MLGYKLSAPLYPVIAFIFLIVFILIEIVWGIISAMIGEADSTKNIINDKKYNLQQSVNLLITKSPEQMLPLFSELPTEYRLGKKKDILKNGTIITPINTKEGLNSDKQLSISKYTLIGSSVMDFIRITFSIYKFDNLNSASDFKNNIIKKLQINGGYKEISFSTNAECFSWKIDYGYKAKFGDSICQNENIIYRVDITLQNSFKQPDIYLKEMTRIIDRKVN